MKCNLIIFCLLVAIVQGFQVNRSGNRKALQCNISEKFRIGRSNLNLSTIFNSLTNKPLIASNNAEVDIKENSLLKDITQASFAGAIAAITVLIVRHLVQIMNKYTHRIYPTYSTMIGAFLVTAIYQFNQNIGKLSFSVNQEKQEIFVSKKHFLLRILGLIASIGTGCSLGIYSSKC